MSEKFIFSSESVGEGHPDKVADFIADTILDACLEQDKQSHVACEVLVKSNVVILAGEITTRAKLDYDRLTRNAIRKIGYTNDDDIFHADKVFITNLLTKQSPDIARGVAVGRTRGKKSSEQGAGDQGIMVGFACRDTKEMLPAPVMFAHRITRKLASLRRTSEGRWLRPDCKSQVAVEYKDDKVVAIRNVVVSTQHTPDWNAAKIKDFIVENVIKKVLPKKLLNNLRANQIYVNPTGKFVIGGPQADAGLTGRKIIVDTYGGWAGHGGGAFSGKDPSKVDRSASYMCRWAAKNLVAAGLANRAELKIAYVIGHSEPTSIHLVTEGNGQYSEAELIAAIKKVFDFRPAEIIKQLDLLRPIYKQTTNYGHFTKQDLPWEQTNKTQALLKTLR